MIALHIHSGVDNRQEEEEKVLTPLFPWQIRHEIHFNAWVSYSTMTPAAAFFHFPSAALLMHSASAGLAAAEKENRLFSHRAPTLTQSVKVGLDRIESGKRKKE